MCCITELAPATASAAAAAVFQQSQRRCRMSGHRRYASVDSFFITTVLNKSISAAKSATGGPSGSGGDSGEGYERKDSQSGGCAKSLQQVSKVHPETKKDERSARVDGGDEVSDESRYPRPEPLRRRSKTEEDDHPHQRDLAAPDDLLAALGADKKSRKTATSKRKEKSRTDDGAAAAATLAVRKSVRFSNVHIREYSIVIGDSPSCNTGIPISLGWDYSTSSLSSFAVDAYERIREPVRRSASGNVAAMELGLSRRRRIEILANVGGYDYKDLVREERRLRMQERDVFFGRKPASIFEERVGA